MTKSGLLVLLLILVPFCATGTTILIPGNSDIFAATGTLPTLPYLVPSSTEFNGIGGQPNDPRRLEGAVPPTIDISTPSNLWVVSFPSITGTVGFSGLAGDSRYASGPGGIRHAELDNGAAPWLSTNVTNTYRTAAGSPDVFETLTISGIQKMDRVIFLVGVFWGPGLTTAPAARNEDNADNQMVVHPLLGQTFYIGTGQTDLGAVRRFYAPIGATKLALGFADGWQFGTDDGGGVGPGWYGDNWGSLTATVELDSHNPEPATFVLIGLPLIGGWFVRRKRG